MNTSSNDNFDGPHTSAEDRFFASAVGNTPGTSLTIRGAHGPSERSARRALPSVFGRRHHDSVKKGGRHSYQSTVDFPELFLRLFLPSAAKETFPRD
jgi:hypothetical protein